MGKALFMSTDPAEKAFSSFPSIIALTPIVAAVLTSFLVIGLAMPVIPLHVHDGLGLSTFHVGLVSGAQFGASFLFRFRAGRHADAYGARHAMMLGLALSAFSGVLYHVSLLPSDSPLLSMGFLLAGRGVLGAGESFIVTAALVWGIARAGERHTGMVMSWVGTAMYIAYAGGAPLGAMLFGAFGFGAMATATTVLPLLALVFVLPLAPTPSMTAARPCYAKVIRAVWLPGIGLALSSVGFGAVTTFVVVLFARNGWDRAWLAFSLLSVFFMFGRICFGHLPDRVGGARVALIFIVIEAAGQACIWLAPSSFMALAGAALTGLGYSLVYPGLGLAAARAAPPHQRGIVMGAYTAFLDLALGIAGPALGLVAAFSTVDLVYGASTLAVLCSVIVACILSRRPQGHDPQPEATAADSCEVS